MRSLKRLVGGASVILALAGIGNVSAAAASTPGFLVSSGVGSYPAKLVGVDSPGSLGDHFSIFGGTYTCNSPKFTVWQEAPSPTLSWTGGETNCTNQSSEIVKFKFNGCGLTFTPGPTAPSYEGKVTTAGSETCGPVVIENFPYHSCKVTLDLHSSYSGTASFTNSGGSVYIQAILGGLHFKSSGGAGCPVVEGTTARWVPRWYVSSYNEAGEPTTLNVVSELP